MESKCAVIFFDEIDALGRSRVDEGSDGNTSHSGGDNSSRRVLAELLIQMTELSSGNIEEDESGDDDSSRSDNDDDVEYEGYCEDRDNFAGDGMRSTSFTGEGIYTQHENNVHVQVPPPHVLSPRSISPIPSSNHSDVKVYKENASSECSLMYLQQEGHPTRSTEVGKHGSSDKRQPEPRVIVVAATNRPEDCDPALLRRFAVRVLVGLPSRKDRKKIIKRLLSDVEHNITPSQLDELALATEGWSGSDLESMTREAVMAPVRECLRTAAILKKKATKVVQRSGADSSQRQELKRVEDAHAATRESLLNSFRNLRPVSSRDFENGLTFWYGEQQETLAFSHFGRNSKHTHYDSSSSSDTED